MTQPAPQRARQPAARPAPGDAPYIRDARALVAYCEKLSREASIAIDLEFRRERTYRAKLELIQLATPEGPAIVDPLAVRDITPVWDLVADARIEKIVHAGSQDMEIFYTDTRTAPRNVYDTQIAAALVGMGEQIGYGDLLHRVLGVRISKLETRTDWSLRPLRPEQIAYALDDVRYLHAIRSRLDERLRAKKRHEWLGEELAHYSDIATYQVDPSRLIAKLPRVRSLNARTLAVLVELIRWREEEAEARDEPRGYILADPMLVEIARRSPKRPDDLATLRGLTPRFIERCGADVVRAVQRATALADDELPALPAARHEDPSRGATVDLLDVFLKQRAVEQEIAPRYLGTKQDITDLVAAHGDGAIAEERESAASSCALLTGWRYELFGRDALAILDGKVDLGIDPKRGAVIARPRGRGGASA